MRSLHPSKRGKPRGTVVLQGPLGSLHSIVPARTESQRGGSACHRPWRVSFSFGSAILFTHQISTEPLFHDRSCHRVKSTQSGKNSRSKHEPCSHEVHSPEGRQRDNYQQCKIGSVKRGLVCGFLFSRVAGTVWGSMWRGVRDSFSKKEVYTESWEYN